MKKIVCSILAGSVFFASACSTQKHSEKKPAPANKPVSKEEVTQNNQQIDQSANAAAKDQSSSKSYSAMSSAMNSTIKALMKSGDLYIKDVNGKNIEDLNVYQQNPTEYFLVLKNKKEGQTNSYYVLRTTADQTATTDAQVTLNVNVSKATGEPASFDGKNLGTPTIGETLVLFKDASKMLENIANIKALAARIQGNPLASSSLLESISSFLFPTAYAATYADKLLWTAIGFTIAAVVSYLFGAFWLGNISTAGGIVFWLLYAFEV